MARLESDKVEQALLSRFEPPNELTDAEICWSPRWPLRVFARWLSGEYQMTELCSPR
jgi:hypothetical protein